MSDKAPPPQVWPTLRARDARALIRFLVDVIGFEETVVYGDGDLVHHAQLSWPLGGGLMMGSAHDADEDPWALTPGEFGAYVVADDIDALHARAAAAGAEITTEPHDTDYGSRDFALRDPEGNRWSFGTYRGEPRTAPDRPTSASPPLSDDHRLERWVLNAVGTDEFCWPHWSKGQGEREIQ